MITRALLAVATLTVPVSLAAVAGQSQQESKVTQTLADWKARLARFQSVRYMLSGVTETVNKPELPPGMKDKIVPVSPGLQEKPLKVSLLIDIANMRFRLEETEPVPSPARDRWITSLRITAYNGDAYQTAFPRANNDRGPNDVDISLSKGNLADMQFAQSYLWPAFMAHGIVPTVDDPLQMGRFPTDHEAEDFEVRGTVTHAGRQCVILRTNPTGTTPNLSDEFWIDPGRQSEILRHTYFQGKNPWFRLDVAYAQTTNGRLPQKWTHIHTIGGKVMTITRFNVDSVEMNPPTQEQDFTLPIEPGMIVDTYDYPVRGKGLDTARPARGKYRVGPDGDWESLEPQTGFATTEGIQLPPAKSHHWLWWGLVPRLPSSYAWGVRFG